MRWSLVVPVKRLELAKTRLRTSMRDGVAGVDHEALVLAMALDTVTAALACPSVGRLLVVTDDPVAAAAVTARGARRVPDTPDAGLNPALEHGAAEARRLTPAWGIAVLGSDLPTLRPDELAEALEAAAAGRAFVADSAGSGTTLLAAPAGVALRPAYGPGSAAAHTRSGAVSLKGRWPSLRRDVDTAEDLAAATVLGLGPHTTALGPGSARDRT